MTLQHLLYLAYAGFLLQRIWDALASSGLSWANPNLGVCSMKAKLGLAGFPSTDSVPCEHSDGVCGANLYLQTG